MLALLALGKLEKAHTFPENDISEELLQSVRISSSGDYGDATHYLELIPFLERKGRFDLIKVIKYKLPQYSALSMKEKADLYIRNLLNKGLVRLKGFTSL
jgi:hypothetical protein